MRIKARQRDIEVTRLEDTLYLEAIINDRSSLETYYVTFMETVESKAAICYIAVRIESSFIHVEDEKVEKEVRTIIDKWLATNDTSKYFPEVS